MNNDPRLHHRRSIRLKGYDYSRPGVYFVTVCTHNREWLFGEITQGKMVLNTYGRVVRGCWDEIPRHFPHVKLDAFVVMPNHVHGIVIIDRVGPRHAVALRGTTTPRGGDTWTNCRAGSFGKPVSGSLPTIIRSFKSAVTKRMNELRRTPGVPAWQRNYHDHIIRDERALNRIRKYILTNPLRWEFDRNKPNRRG